MSAVMLIDGNSLTYRAFFALPTDLATAGGQVTNAVFGFTSMLINLVRDHKPHQIIVAFDRPEPTFRHQRLDSYKANREATPEILREQMGLVRQVIDVLGLPNVELAGYEADDVIATLATAAAAAGEDVLIVTGDRDSYQLVEDPHIRVLYNRRGVSDYALYDEAGIKERTGVTPNAYVQYAALRGDPSDNLPGVPGVGEKTAAKLVNTYGDLDGIFAHTAEQTPKLRSNLEANETKARMNADLMVLDRAVPLDRSLAELVGGVPDLGAVRQLFEFLEFTSLLGRLADAFSFEAPDAVPEQTIHAAAVAPETAPAAADAILAVHAHDGPLVVAGAWQGTEGRSPLAGLALHPCPVEGTDTISSTVLVVRGALIDSPDVQASLRQIAHREAGFVGHDVKPVMRSLLPFDIDIRSLVLDTAVAAYLIEPSDAKYPITDLLRRYAVTERRQPADTPSGQLDFGDEGASVLDDLALDAVSIASVAGPIRAALETRGVAELNNNVEVPLVRVLARMEHAGIGVDRAELSALSEALGLECQSLAAQIQADAGEDFNVNSTPQLRTILFDKLGLTPQKKTKTGFSTDASSLEKLLGEHAIIEHLLRYREVEKLRSTYGEGLLAEISADGRIHATFNQTVARTGRLSSDAPNLHNIPVRSELGRSFRRAFIPAPGRVLLVADYNQIELRCIAHLSEDPGLMAAFEHGDDIHRAVASHVFAVPPEAVTFEQRSRAKMVSYGLAYGMEAYGLAQRLSIPTADAQSILESYFSAFPGVASYMDRVVIEARDRGYTETLFGRRRQIPELSSSNFRIRQAGERQAKNAGIQGLAADIFKVALVRLNQALEVANLRSQIVLQVHDEVLVECTTDELVEVRALTIATMRGAFPLRVELAVNVSEGTTWAAAKG